MVEPNEDAVHIILCIVGSVIDGFNRGRGFTLGPQPGKTHGEYHAFRWRDVLHRLFDVGDGLTRALEERGFESVWAPEHSHIPLSRKTPFPGGGDLPKAYYDAMDPFVVLAAASQVTKTIKLGTGVLLVQQRDAIQTAKLVASIDQVS